jgi:hypothetical protein
MITVDVCASHTAETRISMEEFDKAEEDDSGENEGIGTDEESSTGNGVAT